MASRKLTDIANRVIYHKIIGLVRSGAANLACSDRPRRLNYARECWTGNWDEVTYYQCLARKPALLAAMVTRVASEDGLSDREREILELFAVEIENRPPP
jgi:hypothetical protein